MDSDNIYGTVTPTPVDDQANNSQPTGQQTVYQQQNYQQAGYQQTVYQQPVSQPMYQQPVDSTVVKCPGKEITGMVLGINSLVWSVFAIMFCWMPFYGIVFGIIYGLMGIGCGIATNVLHKKVLETATLITNKIRRGKGMATAGIIIGAIGIGLAIVFCIVWVAAGIGLSKYGVGSHSYYY